MRNETGIFVSSQRIGNQTPFAGKKGEKNRRAKRVEGGLALTVFPYAEDCDSPEGLETHST